MIYVRMPTALLLMLFGSSVSAAAAPDKWPTRPVRVVVPFVAGGGVDSIARIVAAGLGPALGQQAIVDNRPGARGVIGAETVAKANPDGYTLLIISESLTIMPFVERNLPFDVRKSFVPISLLATQPIVLAVHASVPAQSVKEFIAFAKAKPGAISYGSGGFGQHLTGEVIKRTAGFDMTHIPYKGGAQAVIDLVGGQLQAVVLGQSPLLPFVRSGKVRILAITSKARSALLPSVTTLAEAGVPGIDLYQWIYMLAPAKTSKEIGARLNGELSKILAAGETKEKLAAGGFEAAPSTPQELEVMIGDALERWGKLIPQLNIKPE